MFRKVLSVNSILARKTINTKSPRYLIHCIDFSPPLLIGPFASSAGALCLARTMASQEKDTTPGSPGKEEGKQQRRTMTRESVAKNERDKYLKMPVEEKRDHYRCGGQYKTLDDVQTWFNFQLYQQKLANKKKSSRKPVKPLAPVNEALNHKVSIWTGDITQLEIDAIVNAANESLLGGGGVDGAIHRAAGSSLKAECATLGGCKTGDAKITGGYKLPAKHVIHTVGPIGQQEAKLHSCYATCLKLLKENKLKTIAFPCISTGIYGYPNEPAAHVALSTVRNWLDKDKNADLVDRIIFCLFLPVDVDIFEHLMQAYFPMGTRETKDAKKEAVKEDKSDSQEKQSPKKKKVPTATLR